MSHLIQSLKCTCGSSWEFNKDGSLGFVPGTESQKFFTVQIPTREWVGLTQNEVKSCWLGYPARGFAPDRVASFYKRAEQLLKEKNK